MAEIKINFTDSALKKINELKKKNLHLKIIVKKTDFTNYRYDIFPDKIRAIDDVIEFDHIPVMIDPLAKKLGQELEVDYGRKKLLKDFIIRVL